jgi:hypothetical protein
MPDISGGTVIDDLPESILVEEILLRLPSEDVLRCRAVRRSWCTATSTRKFMLDHHARQPSLPIIDHAQLSGTRDSRLLAFRRDAGHGGTLRPVIRCATPGIHEIKLHAALDGLLFVSRTELIDRHPHGERLFYVCNPATRQCAPLQQVAWLNSDVHIAGFYRHHPSREYRVLYFFTKALDVGDRYAYYVLTVGSAGHPRCIWSESAPALPPPASLEFALLDGLPCFSRRHPPPVMHRGSLHWIVPPLDEDDQQPVGAGNATEIQDIIAFDTAGETFRWMRRPAEPGPWPVLFEVNGALALCGTGDGTLRTDLGVWVMQDYEAGVWALMQQIGFYPPSHDCRRFRSPMVVFSEREFIMTSPLCRLLHCEIHGEMLRDVVLRCDDTDDQGCDMEITLHFLKESILPLPFFEMQGEDGANMEHPFILGM